MKTCPTCTRTFEDTFTFCLIDGTVLSPPFDPHATLVLPADLLPRPAPAESSSATTENKVVEPTAQVDQATEILAQESPLTSTYNDPGFEPQLRAKSPVRVGRKHLVILLGLVIGLPLILYLSLAGFTSPNRNGTSEDQSNSQENNAAPPVNNSDGSNDNRAGSVDLADTTWSVVRKTDDNKQYDETFEFHSDGKFVEHTAGDSVDGTWSRSGEEIVIEMPESNSYYAKRITATLNGDSMSGTFDYLGRGADQYFTASKITP